MYLKFKLIRNWILYIDCIEIKNILQTPGKTAFRYKKYIIKG